MEILLRCGQLFVKGDVISEWGIFGAEISFVIADLSLKATSLQAELSVFKAKYPYL